MRKNEIINKNSERNKKYIQYKKVLNYLNFNFVYSKNKIKKEHVLKIE